jgi:hypothetical protein
MVFENGGLSQQVVGLAIKMDRQVWPDAKVTTSSQKRQLP